MSPAVTAKNDTATPAQPDARAGKYLMFQLGNREFAIRVPKVREIMVMQEITVVPRAPSHIKGVINLRGRVVPVIDLGLKFGLSVPGETRRTCIIVLQAQGEPAPVLVGIAVDGVSEVLHLSESEMEDDPEFGALTGQCSLGIAKIKGKVKILLDIDRALATPALSTGSAQAGRDGPGARIG